MADNNTNLWSQVLSDPEQAAMQPETFANPYVKHRIESMAQLLAAPGTAMQSEQPVTTEDMLQPARNMALQFGAVGVPMAKPGTAGIFGGKLAQTADLKALQEAKLMAAGGKHPGQVWQDTGWMRSPADHEWRFEIPDDKSALKYMPMTEGDRALGTTGNLFKHNELYKAYPELQTANMEITKQSPWGGQYMGSTNTLSAMGKNAQEVRSVGLHELQHAIQKKEGFSYGQNPEWLRERLDEGLDKNPSLVKGMKPSELLKVYDAANNIYHKTAGEVEARNTQSRMDLSPQDRRLIYPWSTQDTPYIDQYHYNLVNNTLTALRDRR